MDDKERLSEIIKSSNMSVKRFSEHIGLKTPQILYDIIKGRNGISKDLSEKISSKCLNYNLAWILTGEGNMLKQPDVFQAGDQNINISGNRNTNVGNRNNIRHNALYEVTGSNAEVADKTVWVPYYDMDFIGGLDVMENDSTTNPAYYIHFPQYAKAESWVNVTGHSMEPLINHGDMIAIKRLEDWNTYLLYGEVYAIVTNEYRTIKYVRKSAKGDDYLRLIPANRDFDEQDIPKSVVCGVFQILGCAKRIF